MTKNISKEVWRIISHRHGDTEISNKKKKKKKTWQVSSSPVQHLQFLIKELPVTGSSSCQSLIACDSSRICQRKCIWDTRCVLSHQQQSCVKMKLLEQKNKWWIIIIVAHHTIQNGHIAHVQVIRHAHEHNIPTVVQGDLREGVWNIAGKVPFYFLKCILSLKCFVLSDLQMFKLLLHTKIGVFEPVRFLIFWCLHSNAKFN